MIDVQKTLTEIQEYFRQDYQEDNITILNERFKMSLIYFSMIPNMQKQATEQLTNKLATLTKKYTISVAKLQAARETALVQEIKEIKSLLNTAHRTLQSQISAWKEEHAANRFGGGNIT